MLLMMSTLIDQIRARAGRLRDEDGAINTVEMLIIIGVVIILVGVVLAIVQTKASNEANSLNLG